MKKLIAVTMLTLSATAVGIVSNAALASTDAAKESQQTHQTTGVVKNVDKEKGRVTLAHQEVPSLNWPGMTMGFAVEDQALLNDLERGQSIDFDFTEGKGGKFVITQVRPQ